jgi:hypothetical protein
MPTTRSLPAGGHGEPKRSQPAACTLGARTPRPTHLRAPAPPSALHQLPASLHRPAPRSIGAVPATPSLPRTLRERARLVQHHRVHACQALQDVAAADLLHGSGVEQTGTLRLQPPRLGLTRMCPAGPSPVAGQNARSPTSLPAPPRPWPLCCATAWRSSLLAMRSVSVGSPRQHVKAAQTPLAAHSPLTSRPRRAPRLLATSTAVGVASPKAQGQATTWPQGPMCSRRASRGGRAGAAVQAALADKAVRGFQPLDPSCRYPPHTSLASCS